MKATSFTTARSSAKAGLVIGALEDNDDNDDTATGNCGWVLSIRDKHKLDNFSLQTSPPTSVPLKALTGARAKTEAREDAADADATAICTTVASIYQKYKNFSIAFFGRSCCCYCCCNCMLHTGCNNNHRIQTELKDFDVTLFCQSFLDSLLCLWI
jgi:hypothetical protein